MYCLRKTWDHMVYNRSGEAPARPAIKWLDNCKLTVVDSTHIVDNLQEESMRRLHLAVEHGFLKRPAWLSLHT